MDFYEHSIVISTEKVIIYTKYKLYIFIIYKKFPWKFMKIYLQFVGNYHGILWEFHYKFYYKSYNMDNLHFIHVFIICEKIPSNYLNVLLYLFYNTYNLHVMCSIIICNKIPWIFMKFLWKFYYNANGKNYNRDKLQEICEDILLKFVGISHRIFSWKIMKFQL